MESMIRQQLHMKGPLPWIGMDGCTRMEATAVNSMIYTQKNGMLRESFNTDSAICRDIFPDAELSGSFFLNELIHRLYSMLDIW